MIYSVNLDIVQLCRRLGRLSANDTDADAAKLRRFLSERSKILPRRTTGTCAACRRHQTEANRCAPQISLLPFVAD